jgi:hypothetical protein
MKMGGEQRRPDRKSEEQRDRTEQDRMKKDSNRPSRIKRIKATANVAE